MNATDLKARLRLPVVVAPMFLVSGPELVIASCKAGLVGSFPSLNARTSSECAEWLTQIEDALAAASRAGIAVAPYAMNLIVRDAERLEQDLQLAERFGTPVVITSVGDPSPVVARVHAYGGLVFHDVGTVRHAQKAIAAGVDGLILLTAGAGGHTGSANPFAFVRAVRAFWDGAILLSGAIADGAAIRAAEVLGADFAYIGTRFAASQEARADPAYKRLLVEQKLVDVLTTDRITGLSATFLRGSIEAVGLDPDKLPPPSGLFRPNLPEPLRAWRDIWSAGHGVELIDDTPPVAVIADRLIDQYRAARG